MYVGTRIRWLVPVSFAVFSLYRINRIISTGALGLDARIYQVPPLPGFLAATRGRHRSRSAWPEVEVSTSGPHRLGTKLRRSHGWRLSAGERPQQEVLGERAVIGDQRAGPSERTCLIVG